MINCHFAPGLKVLGAEDCENVENMYLATMFWQPNEGILSVYEMRRVHRERQLHVCLISSHPLFLAEAERNLSAIAQIETFRLSPGKSTNAPDISPADVYVLDAYPHWRFAADIVGALLNNKERGGYLLMLAEQFTDEEAFPLLKIGVKGLLTYAEAASQLSLAVTSVAQGGYWVPRSLLSRFVDSILKTQGKRQPLSKFARLSRREKDVLDLLLQNLSNKDIANKLNISERTAKFHVSNLLSKYDVQRRADLILLWFQDSRSELAYRAAARDH